MGGPCYKQCRLLFPKVFLFNSASLPQRLPAEASASAREGRKHSSWVGSLAIASDISFVLLSFIIILPLSLPTRFVFFSFFFFFLFVVVLLLCCRSRAKLNWPLRCTKDADFADLPSRSPSVSIVSISIGPRAQFVACIIRKGLRHRSWPKTCGGNSANFATCRQEVTPNQSADHSQPAH